MRKIKVVLWLITVFPILFIICVSGGPFYVLCCWAGERETIGPMMDRVGEKIKQSLINFAI